MPKLAKLRPASAKHAALIKFFEGKARYQEHRYDLTEECWNEALRLDPLVPEAGWVLVDLLDRESRTSEAHRLGMRLHEVEPDPRDRVKILLEMIRLDIEFPDPLSQVELFRNVVEAHPEHVPLVLTMGVALIRTNHTEEGLELIRGALKRKPRAPEVWDTWLTALYDASEVDKLATEYARLPQELATDPRFAKHEGMIAQIARDWPKAEAAYRRAFEFEPYNWGVCYRLRFVLRLAGDAREFARVDRLYEAYKAAYKQVRGSFFERFDAAEKERPRLADIEHSRGAYYETLAIDTLGITPHPELYQRLRNCANKWVDLTRHVPGIAWCCATPPAMRSVWQPSSGSSNIECTMTTTADVAASSECASTVSSPPSQPRRPRRSIIVTLAGVVLAGGLAAFNGWWYWRDHRPLPDLTAINELMRRQKYAEATRALAEVVRRSPHAGDGWIALARALAGKGELEACARALHQVPSWSPQKPEALLREGQALMQLNRARDAERAWFEAIHDDPLHPVAAEIYHDAAQELLKLYAIEDRWEDAYPVMWLAYDHAPPIDHPALLVMRMRPELERVAPKETIALLKKYVAADVSDWEARRA